MMKGKDLEESCDSNWTHPEYKSGMLPLYQSAWLQKKIIRIMMG
jgi:hypothetical protein